MQVNSITQVPDFDLSFRKSAEQTESSSVKGQINQSPESKKHEPSAELIELQNVLAEHSINLKFSRDRSTNQIVVALVDVDTGEEIRQTPSEVSLKLAAISEQIQGQFVDKQL